MDQSNNTITRLKNAIFRLVEGSTTKELIDLFDFEDGFEIVDAIEHYRSKEMFHAFSDTMGG